MVKPPRFVQVEVPGKLYPACLRLLFAAVVAIALVLPGCQKKQQGGEDTAASTDQETAVQASPSGETGAAAPGDLGDFDVVDKSDDDILADSVNDTLIDPDSLLQQFLPSPEYQQPFDKLSYLGINSYNDTLLSDTIPIGVVRQFRIVNGGGTDSAGYGALADSVRGEFGSLPSYDSLCMDANFIALVATNIGEHYYLPEDQDRRRMARRIALTPLKDKLRRKIKAYRLLAAFGVPPPGGVASVLRKNPVTDSLHLRLLPKAGTSEYLADGHFFFLGAGPFLKRYNSESAFTDAQGKPEIRFSCQINANTARVLDAMRHFEGVRVMVHPYHHSLPGYEGGGAVNAFVNQFAVPVPVFFLTEEGIVRGSLISVLQKLIPDEAGCVSDFPEIIFSCSSLPDEEILGVYIPYAKGAPPTCSIKRTGELWTADLDGDGIPEIAGVTGLFDGAASDTMYRIAWFANIRGVWKIIDTAEDLDCT